MCFHFKVIGMTELNKDVHTSKGPSYGITKLKHKIATEFDLVPSAISYLNVTKSLRQNSSIAVLQRQIFRYHCKTIICYSVMFINLSAYEQYYPNLPSNLWNYPNQWWSRSRSHQSVRVMVVKITVCEMRICSKKLLRLVLGVWHSGDRLTKSYNVTIQRYHTQNLKTVKYIFCGVWV